MTRRYYTPELIATHPLVRLPEDEAAHAFRVMRVVVGDEVELFDGRGNQAMAKIVSANRRECVCESETPRSVDREPRRSLELVTALPKPERAKEMIERLTELGVTCIQPLVFERTQRPPTDALIVKLERAVIEACKQSGRNQLMAIAPVLTFRKWIGAMAGSEEMNPQPEATSQQLPLSSFVAMPGGGSFADAMPSVARETPDARGRLRCLIGPEGGLTETELAACRDRSMVAIDLGKRILRIETAACLVASRFLWD